MIKKLWNSPTFMTWGNLTARTSSLVILLPVVLITFSQEDIVIWYLYFTIISLQLLLDFGFLPTFTRLFTYAHSGLSIKQIENIKNNNNANGKPNFNSLSQIFMATKSVYSKISLISFLLAISLGSWFVNDPINNSSNPLESWIGWVSVIFIASFSIYTNSFVAFLLGINKVALIQRWQMLTSFLAVLTSAIIIYVTKSLMLGIIIYNIWYVVNFLINYYLFKKYYLYKDYNINSIKVKRLIRITIWPTAWRSGIGVIMSIGLIQFSGMIVAKFETASIAASYMIGLQFIRTISNFAQVPFYSKLPEFTKMYSENKINQLLDYAKNNMLKVYLLYIFGFGIIGLFGNQILLLLGSKTLIPNSFLWSLFGIAFFIERFGAMNIQLYTLTNHIIWHKANGYTGISMIILSMILYPIADIYGLVLAMIISYMLIYIVYSLKYTYLEFNLTFFDFEKKSFIPSFVLLLITLLIILFLGQ